MHKFFISMLLIVGFGFCCDALESCSNAGTADLINNLLHDPQLVYSWFIRQHASLLPGDAYRKAIDEGDIFKEPYQKQNFQDLTIRQKEAVVWMGFKINKDVLDTAQKKTIVVDKCPTMELADYLWIHQGFWQSSGICQGSQVTLEGPEDKDAESLWRPLSIWMPTKYLHFDNVFYYLMSYHRNEAPNQVLWVVGRGGKPIWRRKSDIKDQIPGPSDNFPELIKENLVFTHQDVTKLLEQINASEAKQEQNRSVTLKWSCIVGGTAVLLTALVLSCGFKCFYSNQKKKWQSRRESKVGGAYHDDEIGNKIVDDDQTVVLAIQQNAGNDASLGTEVQESATNELLGKLMNHRPPVLVDECEKYGMGEIYNVTAGEGSDLVRIARPLETAGASRKLSEALLDIQPIYQDQEGRESWGLHGTSYGGTEGGDVMGSANMN